MDIDSLAIPFIGAHNLIVVPILGIGEARATMAHLSLIWNYVKYV